MAFQAIKDTKLPTSLCRLSPPSSPSRCRVRTISTDSSKALAHSDNTMAGIEASHAGVPQRRVEQSHSVTSRSAHPFLMGCSMGTSSTSHSIAGLSARPNSVLKPRPFPMLAAPYATQASPENSPSTPLSPSSSTKSKQSAQALKATRTVRRAAATSANPSTESPTDGAAPTPSTKTTSNSKSNKRAASKKSKSAKESETQSGGEDALPVYSYKDFSPVPAVVYTRHAEEADELVGALVGPLGFDMEWCFSRRPGAVERPTALVQVCDARMVVLVHISEMKQFPSKLREIIESADIVKTGANIAADGRKLFRDFGIKPANLVELGALAHAADPSFSATYTRTVVSLARMVERYTRTALEKDSSVRCGDWEATPLSEQQIDYAANDVHCGLLVYKRLEAIAAEEGRALVPTTYAWSYGDARVVSKAVRSTVAVATGPGPSASASASASARRSGSEGPGASRAFCTAAASVLPGRQVQMELAPEPPTARDVMAHLRRLRAYRLWHRGQKTLPQLCAALGGALSPLPAPAAITYVVEALQADASLPFDLDRLRALVHSESRSWARDRAFVSGPGYMLSGLAPGWWPDGLMNCVHHRIYRRTVYFRL
ncbi:hypothetical protein WOLCODRAFT_167591, partial [Wolfiporia cocos MD-104 SS10]